AGKRRHLPRRGPKTLARQGVMLDELVELDERRAHETPKATSSLMQRAAWEGESSTGPGSAASQAAMVRGQRPAKGHPGGISASSGTVPLLVASFVPRPTPSLGRAPNKPCV